MAGTIGITADLEAAVTQLQEDVERVNIIINGDALTSAVAEDGSPLPSIRKVLVDNLYYKTPLIPWIAGQTARVFNQLYSFTDAGHTTWWFAPGATNARPVSLGQRPDTDPNWRLLLDSSSIEGIYAKIISPSFEGNPTAPTPVAGDKSTSIATTDFVTSAIELVSGKNPTFDSLTVTGKTLTGELEVTGTVTLQGDTLSAARAAATLNKISLDGVDAQLDFVNNGTAPSGATKKTVIKPWLIETDTIKARAIEADTLKVGSLSAGNISMQVEGMVEMDYLHLTGNETIGTGVPYLEVDELTKTKDLQVTGTTQVEDLVSTGTATLETANITDANITSLDAEDAIVSHTLKITNPDKVNPVFEVEGKMKIKGNIVNDNDELIGAPVDSSNFKVTENAGRQYVDYSAYTPPNGVNVLKVTYNPEGPPIGEPANPLVVMMSTEDNNAMRFDSSMPLASPTAGMKVLVSKDPANGLVYQDDGTNEGLFVSASGGGSGNGLLAVRKFTNTTAAETYTPTAGTKSILLKMIGGGGAGGNCPGAAPSAGGGGGAGAYCEHYMTTGFTGINIAVGAGGTRTTPAVDTVITLPSSAGTITAGRGEPGVDGVTNTAISLGGVGGGMSVVAPITNVIQLAGSVGGNGMLFGTAALSGVGADSQMGIGGVARDNLSFPAGADGAGSLTSANNKMGYGAGGSGAVAGSTALYRAGGVGGQGVVYIYELG